MYRAVFLLAFFAVARAQIHGDRVSCYDCHHAHDLQECMNHRKECHGDEICQVKYGGAHPEIKCRKQHDCQREVDESARTCSGGGSLVHGSCQVCCADDACLTSTINAATTAQTSGDGVHCPADCALDNLAACVTAGHLCNGNQYCEVKLDEHNGHIHGKCENMDHIQHCEDEVIKSQDHCGHGGCWVGCCTDDNCVAGTLGGNLTVPTSAGECMDQLEGDQCTALDASKSLCNDRLALRVCPDTCGLCDLYNGTQCHDIVNDNGCATLKDTEDICNNPLAIDLCPVTCNLCGQWLDNKINAALQNGTMTSSTVAPMSCSAIADYSCDILNTLCSSLDCPAECAKCAPSAAPTAAASTTMAAAAPASTTAMDVSQLTCASLVGVGCGVLDGLCPLMDCPDECNPCYQPIQTGATSPAAAVSTPAPSGDPSCVDNMQGGMSCSDVVDVCSSPLLSSYCPKFCGTC